jgi:hypothetical protein
MNSNRFNLKILNEKFFKNRYFKKLPTETKDIILPSKLCGLLRISPTE